MIEIYCGDGKGKTTAAVGLSVRAAGCGFRVLFVQFMKDGSSGEIQILKKLPGVIVLHARKFYGFSRNMNEVQRQEMKEEYELLLKKVKEAVSEEKEQPMLIVLDEILHACNHCLLKEEALYAFLDECPDTAEVVLTGRNPSEELIKRADYLSDVRKVKHPYDRGVLARKGIEL